MLLLKMIVKYLQPFSIVEDVGFKAYSAGLDPTYVLPSRTTMVKVRQTIENEAEYVTLTTDCWTSKCTEGYMAVTAHFILKKWVLKSMLLQTLRATYIRKPSERVNTCGEGLGNITKNSSSCVSQYRQHCRSCKADWMEPFRLHST